MRPNARVAAFVWKNVPTAPSDGKKANPPTLLPPVATDAEHALPNARSTPSPKCTLLTSKLWRRFAQPSKINQKRKSSLSYATGAATQAQISLASADSSTQQASERYASCAAAE